MFLFKELFSNEPNHNTYCYGKSLPSIKHSYRLALRRLKGQTPFQLLKKTLLVLLILQILVYRYCLSPILPNSCKFYPTCSCYAISALKIHGVFRGSWLTIKRLFKCSTFSNGGYDPVP